VSFFFPHIIIIIIIRRRIPMMEEAASAESNPLPTSSKSPVPSGTESGRMTPLWAPLRMKEINHLLPQRTIAAAIASTTPPLKIGLILGVSWIYMRDWLFIRLLFPILPVENVKFHDDLIELFEFLFEPFKARN
jgi:hypothetical protein